jgi:very-short-patch-repair endonuclease
MRLPLASPPQSAPQPSPRPRQTDRANRSVATERPFGKFILDFVSHPARLVVEVDGSQRGQKKQTEHDAERTEWLRSEGYRVLRFWNSEALCERDGVWRTIQSAAAETPALARMQRWRKADMARVRDVNAQIASFSMEEAPAQRAEEVRAVAAKKEPQEANPSRPLASPPQSALRAASSSIEEERGASFGEAE